MKASVLLIWLTYMQVIFLANVMYQLLTMLVLMLLLHKLTYCLVVVLLSASIAILAIFRTLLGRMPCSTVLVTGFSFVHSRHTMDLFQCILFNYVKVFCFFYLIKG